MSAPHYIPHDAGQDPFMPGPATAADVTIQRMYYTLCQVCGCAFNDWTDSMAGARRNRREHLEKHKQSADQMAAVMAATRED